MIRIGLYWILVCGMAVQTSTAAITVTFEEIARSGDPVPGRETLNVVFNGRAFQHLSYTDGVLSRPSINASGEVVFRGVSSHPSNFNTNSAVGLYAKSPGFPLIVLADTTTDVGGNPTFAVPGQSVATQFTNFKPPLINDRGDVLFYATYGSATGSGSGFYAMTTTGGPIVKLVDSTDTVPGWPGTTFGSFAFGGVFGRFTLGSLNDVGQVVFMGVFNAPDDTYQDVGIYGTTVAGGLLVRLADATGSMTMVDQDPSITIHGLQQDRHAALNNAGMVVFGADIGATPFVAQRAVLAVPVDGSAGIRTLAKRYQPVLLSDGASHALFASFNGHDINDSGQFMFQHTFSSGTGAINALVTGDINVPGSPLSGVVDNAGGLTVPQRPGSNFTGIRMTALNDSGQLGFDALTDVPANSSGLYSTDLTGGPVGFVTNSSTAPPGRPGLVFNSFGPFDIPSDGESVVINNSGNMALTAYAINEAGTGITFGLYFFDSCTGNLERVVDETTSSPAAPVGLGDVFVGSGCAGFPCQRFFMMWDGSNTRAGHYRSINDNNDVAFITAFSTFNVGVYVAHVSGGGGGSTTITCPADAAVECGLPSDPGVTGSATAAGGCSGASVPTTFSDVVVPGLGGTETIARTWTADDGAGGVATCNQIISVVDSIAPTLSGVPANASVECDAVPSAANPTVSDTCDPAPTLAFAETRVDGACANQYTLTRTWTATDGSNNVTTQSQLVSVGDSVPPSLLGVPADTVVECDAIPAAANVSAVDNCDAAATVSFSEAQTGACLASATLTRTWTSVDACGNAGGATQVITVQDTTPPVASAGLTLLSGGDVEGSGTHDDDEGIFAVGASCSDNCAGAAGCAATTVSAVLTCSNGVSVAVTPGQFVEIEAEDEGGCEIEIENGRLEVEGDVTLTVTCTDAAGNTATATAIPVGLAMDNDTDADSDD